MCRAGKFGLHLWKSGATRHLVGALAPRMPDRVLCAVLKALYSSIRLSWAAERFARGSEQSRNDFYDVRTVPPVTISAESAAPCPFRAPRPNPMRMLGVLVSDVKLSHDKDAST